MTEAQLWLTLALLVKGLPWVWGLGMVLGLLVAWLVFTITQKGD